MNRFEPAGMTSNSDIPFAKSLVDYIFRWLGMRFIPGYREANLPQRVAKPAEPAETSAASRKSTPKSSGGDSRWSTQTTSGAATDRSAKNEGPIARIGLQPGDTTDRLTRPETDGSLARHAVVVHEAHTTSTHREESTVVVVEEHVSALSAAMSENMGDSPPCDVCGEITVRNGTCYKCMGCGNSMGCS